MDRQEILIKRKGVLRLAIAETNSDRKDKLLAIAAQMLTAAEGMPIVGDSLKDAYELLAH